MTSIWTSLTWRKSLSLRTRVKKWFHTLHINWASNADNQYDYPLFLSLKIEERDFAVTNQMSTGDFGRGYLYFLLWYLLRRPQPSRGGFARPPPPTPGPPPSAACPGNSVPWSRVPVLASRGHGSGTPASARRERRTWRCQGARRPRPLRGPSPLRQTHTAPAPPGVSPSLNTYTHTPVSGPAFRWWAGLELSSHRWRPSLGSMS